MKIFLRVEIFAQAAWRSLLQRHSIGLFSKLLRNVLKLLRFAGNPTQLGAFCNNWYQSGSGTKDDLLLWLLKHGETFTKF